MRGPRFLLILRFLLIRSSLLINSTKLLIVSAKTVILKYMHILCRLDGSNFNISKHLPLASTNCTLQNKVVTFDFNISIDAMSI